MYYIYQITNLLNGRIYVGQHNYSNIDDNYMGSGKTLLKAYKKYGKGNFEKLILEDSIFTKEEADSREKYWISIAKDWFADICYNIADGGQGGNLGVEVCETMKKTMLMCMEKRTLFMENIIVKRQKRN